MYNKIKNLILDVELEGEKIIKKVGDVLWKERPYWLLFLESWTDSNISNTSFRRGTEYSCSIYFNKLEQGLLSNIVNSFLSIKYREVELDNWDIIVVSINNYNVEYSEEEGENIILTLEIEVEYNYISYS